MRSTYVPFWLVCAFAFCSACALNSPDDAPATPEPDARSDMGTTPEASDQFASEQGDERAGWRPGLAWPPSSPTDAGVMIAALDGELEAASRRAEARPEDWLVQEQLAALRMQRARLTHSWEDWDQADLHLKRAFEIAAPESGPFLTRATLNFSLHRFPEVDSDLDRASKSLLLQDGTRAAIASRRAELAVQRGQLDRARERLDEALSFEPAVALEVQRGVLAFKTGDHEGARARLDAARQMARSGDDLTLAWATLHRGIIELDSGHTDQAHALFEEANTVFSGWYLIEEHLAETLALRGEHARARAIYESVVARVEAGEFFEALADSCEALGDEACATSRRQAAAAQYAEDLRDHPQAAYGHGMDFFLQAEDKEAMTTIAEANYALRPGYDAATKLAQARVRTGRLKQARQLIEGALQGGWSTADLHATAAVVYALQGDTSSAEAQRQLARARHPDAIEELAWLTVLP